MSDSKNINKQGIEGNPLRRQFTGEQATALQQLQGLLSDIEGQGYLLAIAVNSIAEALDKGENVSREMMNHVKAQILRAHLQLDDLEQLLDPID